MNQNTRIFYTQVKLHWGYIIRYPGSSASQPAFILPPPTTLIGALTYSLARYYDINDPKLLNPLSKKELRYGEGVIITPLVKRVIESTITIGLGIDIEGSVNEKIYTGIIHQLEPSRLITFMYKGSAEKRRSLKPLGTTQFYVEALPRIITTLGAGHVIAPGITFHLIWVFRIDQLASSIKVSTEQLDRELINALAGITRVGSKESIVSIDPRKSIYIKEPRIIQPGSTFRSVIYQPTKCVDKVYGNTRIIKLYGLDYKFEDYYVPLSDGTNSFIIPLPDPDLAPIFRLKDNCVAYTLEPYRREVVISGYVR